MHKQQFDDVIYILTTEDEGRIWKIRFSLYGLVTPEREVAGSILGPRPILRVLNKLQAARLSRGSYDNVPSPAGDVKIVSLVSTFMLKTLTLK